MKSTITPESLYSVLSFGGFFFLVGIFCFGGFLGGLVVLFGAFVCLFPCFLGVFLLPLAPPLQLGGSWLMGQVTHMIFGVIGAPSVAAAKVLLPREVKTVTRLSTSGSFCFCYPGKGAELLRVVSWHQRSENCLDV